MEISTDKIGSVILFNSVKDCFSDILEKFHYGSEEEKDKFYNDNVYLKELFNLIVPQEIFVKDSNGITSSIPYQIFFNDSFVIDSKQKILTNAIEVLVWSNLIKDELFAFGKSTELLSLSEDEKFHIYYVLFLNLMHVRIKIWNKYKNKQENNDLANISIDKYSIFIEIDTINEESVNEFKGQMMYFDSQVTFEPWKNLIYEISASLSGIHSQILNNVTNCIKEPSIENFNYISDKLFIISSEREARSRICRNTHKEYDEYTIKQLKRTKDYIFSLMNVKQQYSNITIMGDNYSTKLFRIMQKTSKEERNLRCETQTLALHGSLGQNYS